MRTYSLKVCLERAWVVSSPGLGNVIAHGMFQRFRNSAPQGFAVGRRTVEW
jgi:hypothetical protein